MNHFRFNLSPQAARLNPTKRLQSPDAICVTIGNLYRSLCDSHSQPVKET
jgi:hypothetical protein